MNLLENASFETTAAWVPSEDGAFLAVPAETAVDGDSVGLLVAGTTPGGADYSGSLTQTAVRSPAVYHAGIWCLQLTSAAPDVAVTVVEGGVVREIARLEPGATGVWRLLSATFVSEAAITAFVVGLTDSLAGQHEGQWYVDAAELMEVTVARGLREVYLATIEQLKTINGDGYHHNVEGRVFPGLFFPGEPRSIKGVPWWICVPLEHRAAPESTEPDLVNEVYQQPVYIVFNDYATDDPANSVEADAAAWHDDLWRCFMEGSPHEAWRFGDVATIDDVDVGEVSLQVRGFSPQRAHVRFLLSIKISFTRAELGPDA